MNPFRVQLPNNTFNALFPISAEALKKLAKDHHIYVTTDEGRMSLTGLNSGNVDYVAQCIHQVVMGN